MRASVRRLEQTLSHVRSDPRPSALQLSLVEGPTKPELSDITLGELLTFQRLQYGDHECLVFPWTGTRWTYAELSEESNQLARGLLALGVNKGDRIGIMAGNCEQYISLFFAAARVGAILVVLNNTYTASEVHYALDHTGLCTPCLQNTRLDILIKSSDCRFLFITPQIGRHSNAEVLSMLGPHPTQKGSSAALEQIIILRGSYEAFGTYEGVIERGQSVSLRALEVREDSLHPEDVCNLQFTSGSTGNPKAAMLTHRYIYLYPNGVKVLKSLTSQKSGQQFPLYRRPYEPDLVRYPVLPTTAFPLLWPGSRDVSRCYSRIEDRLSRRDV